MIMMNEFVLLFRMDITSPEAQPTPQQMQQYMKDWMAWINDIEGNGRLSGGNHLMPAGKIVTQNNISDGVYTKNKESVAGYITVLAKDMDEALRIARQCPILAGEGNSVEVRQTANPGA